MAASEGDRSAAGAVFDTSPIPLCGFAGPDHVHVAANRAYRELVDRPDVLGRTSREVFPEQLHPRLDRVYATGRPETAREVALRIERHGRLDDVVLTIGLVARRGRGGAIVGVNAYLVDVTADVAQRGTAGHGPYETVRDVVDAVQRELLPAALPVLPGLELAATYLTGASDVSAGGDWFDAVMLPGGRVVLVVGDVVGHGVAASATMARLRAGLSDRLADGADLADAVAAVDRSAAHHRGTRVATACVAVVDPAAGTVEYCTAGHPPPLLIPATGEARYLPATGTGPLGTGSAPTVGTAVLDVGALLVLYSDGLIERPEWNLPASTVELARVAAEAAAGQAPDGGPEQVAERVCAQTLELLLRAAGHSDDVTVLAAQRVAPAGGLELRVPADRFGPGAVRAGAGAWLELLGVDDEDVTAVQHALGELVTNAVEHSGSGRSGVTVTADLDGGGRLRAQVRDHGSWRDTAPGRVGPGRGLALVASLSDELHVDRGAGGTTVTLVRRLSRPVRLLTAADLPWLRPAVPTREELVLVLERTVAAAPRLRVAGPVDTATAGRLHAELRQASAGGALPLTVDLAAVTHLGSAGVAVLFDVVGRNGGPLAGVEIYAPAGSVAQQVLALVHLAHVTGAPQEPPV